MHISPFRLNLLRFIPFYYYSFVIHALYVIFFKGSLTLTANDLFLGQQVTDKARRGKARNGIDYCTSTDYQV